MPYKKDCFYKTKSFEKKKILYFCLRLLSRKCVLQSFDPKCLRNCYRPRFILSLIFVLWKSIAKIKFMVPIMHRQTYFTKGSKFELSSFSMKPESSLVFKSLSSIENFVSLTKF